MIVALCGQKGGSGKTTTAVSLAVEWGVRGRRVLLVDLDPQGSTRTWGDVGARHGAITPTVVSMGVNVVQQLPALATHYDVTVIDCPPRHGELQRAALLVADVALLPCGPSGLDGWALLESIDLVRQAQALRPSIEAATIITRRIPRTTTGAAARGALETAGLRVLASELAFRVPYQEALTAGLGPTTYAPRSPAAAEVRAAASELEVLFWPQKPKGTATAARTRKAKP